MLSIHPATRIVKRPVRLLQQFTRIIRFCRRTTPLFSTDYPKIFFRALRLCCLQHFTPKEAFNIGLLNPNLHKCQLKKYASRKNWTKLQQTLNPQQWEPILKNKSIFYRYCMALDIPIPKLYAVFFKNAAGWTCNGTILKNRNDWEEFLKTQLPQEFVIKPARGALGRDIQIFTRTKNSFTDAFQNPKLPNDIYNEMLKNQRYDNFIIQQKLKNHREIFRLTATDHLQTMRIITFVDDNAQPHILRAHIKLIIGQNVIDNFENGRTGNIQVVASTSTGRLKNAITMTQNGRGTKTIKTHPKTKKTFKGFQLPLWPQTRTLIEKTAMKFLPVRTIGWDVAITPKGPVILEGNIWWNPPNQHQCMDVLTNTLEEKIR